MPASISDLEKEEFIDQAWGVVGRKVSKRAFLEEMYELAHRSAALPVSEESPAIQMFRLQLRRYLELCGQRADLEELAQGLLHE